MSQEENLMTQYKQKLIEYLDHRLEAYGYANLIGVLSLRDNGYLTGLMGEFLMVAEEENSSLEEMNEQLKLRIETLEEKCANAESVNGENRDPLLLTSSR